MHLPSSRAARAGFSLMMLALGACTDRSNPVSVPPAPSRASRDVSGPGAILVVTNTNGGALAGSLRDAVNRTTGGEVIQFDPSIAGSTITLDTTIDIPNNITIEGPVDKGVTISGGGKFTVFVTHKGVTIANLTITGGKDFHLSPAGGILDTGALVIKQSTIAGNAGAGAIFGDNITVINSTVTNNLGTGIDYKFQGTFTLINSTVSNNAAGIDAFDVESGPTPTVLLKNSIIAGNQASCGLGASFLDGFSYAGVNISSDKTCGTPILNMIVTDPLLGDLADNGGPTQTRALDRNSPAINATDCPDVTVDQRFVPRDAKCDIGAFEFVFTTISLTIDPTAQVDPSTGAATVTGTIQCSRNEAFNLAVELTQNQKHKGTPVVVDDTEVIGVSCGTTAKPWIAQVAPPSGAVFDNSDATVSATTVAIANGVIPSSVSTAVKVFRQK